MRADLNVQMAKAKAQSAATWSGSEVVCAVVQQEKNTELCGDDHAPVTRGRMRAQYPLPHPPPPPCRTSVMTMRLGHGGVCEPSIRCLMAPSDEGLETNRHCGRVVGAS